MRSILATSTVDVIVYSELIESVVRTSRSESSVQLFTLASYSQPLLLRRWFDVEMRLYWEFPWVPWVPWEFHGNGNHSANFMGMGMGTVSYTHLTLPTIYSV